MKNLLIFIFVISNIALFSQQGFTTFSCTLTQSSSYFKNLSAIELGAGSDVWIGLNSNTNNKTLLKFDGAAWTDYATQVNFPIQALKYDGAGNLWIGSSTGGLLKFDGATYTQYTTSNSSIISNNVLSIELNGTNVLVGTNAGISIYDGANFTNYSKANSGLSSDTIYAFEKDASGNIWIGSAIGLNMMNTSNVISALGINDKVYDVMIDGAGDKWLGTDASGLLRYNGSNFTNALQISGTIIGANYPDKIYSIAKSPAGNPIVCAKNRYINYQEGLVEILPQGGHKALLNKQGSFGFDKIFANINNGVIYYLSKTKATPNFTKLFLHKFVYNQFDIAKDFVNITNYNTEYLDINNVKAACNPGADIHGDGMNPMYEVPKGSGKFCNAKTNLWIGAYVNGQLRIAANTYRQLGLDFQPGVLPINTVGGILDTATIMYYNKVWKVNKFDVESFKYHYQLGNVQNGSYTIPSEILTWPGNPIDIEGYLAPYFDYNNDGSYNPYDGDYPYYKNADQILFWVVNDYLTHLETGSILPLGIQLGVTAYAYTCPQINDTDKVINNTTFYNYRIINKTNEVFDSVYVGTWLDPDLGNYMDDYIGCDVQNNFGFIKNGDNYDDDGSFSNGYKSNTPYYSLNFLRGGTAPFADGIDNDRDGCIDCSWQLDPVTHEPNTSLPPIYETINNPEEIRMSGFGYSNNTGDAVTGNPTSSGNGLQYYRFLKGFWKTGSPMRYDLGPGTSTVTTNPITRYMYPGQSDPLGYCVGGGPNNPIVMPQWDEVTAGNVPGDRRFMANAGPFSIPAYGIENFDIALVFTQDSASVANNILDIKVVSDNKKVYNWWKFNEAPSCFDLSGVGLKEYKGNIKVNLFPNPATTKLTIDAGYENEIKEIKVLDVLGKEIMHQTISSKNKTQINIENYNSGVYLIQVKCANGEFFGKFIKH
jgi:hypothetical protein